MYTSLMSRIILIHQLLFTQLHNCASVRIFRNEYQQQLEELIFLAISQNGKR